MDISFFFFYKQHKPKKKKKKKKKTLKTGNGGIRKRRKKKMHCTCTWAFLLFTHYTSPHQLFSPFWEENFLMTRRENTQPHYLFPLSPFQPNTFQKVFLPFFFSSKIHSTKHTLKVFLRNSCLYFPYQLASVANKLEIGKIIILGSLSFFFSINLISIIFNYLLLKKKAH